MRVFKYWKHVQDRDFTIMNRLEGAVDLPLPSRAQAKACLLNARGRGSGGGGGVTGTVPPAPACLVSLLYVCII